MWTSRQCVNRAKWCEDWKIQASRKLEGILKKWLKTVFLMWVVKYTGIKQTLNEATSAKCIPRYLKSCSFFSLPVIKSWCDKKLSVEVKYEYVCRWNRGRLLPMLGFYRFHSRHRKVPKIKYLILFPHFGHVSSQIRVIDNFRYLIYLSTQGTRTKVEK